MGGNRRCDIDAELYQEAIDHHPDRGDRRIHPVDIAEVRVVGVVVDVDDQPAVETADAAALHAVALHEDGDRKPFRGRGSQPDTITLGEPAIGSEQRIGGDHRGALAHLLKGEPQGQR